MSVQIIHSNFTAGEITPLLHARVDYTKYNNAAKSLQNVIVLPQGGLTNRFGTLFQYDLNIDDFNNVKIGILNYDNVNKYTIVFLPHKILIFLDAILKTDIGTSYLPGEIIDLRFKQNGNKMAIVHKDHNPVVLSRSVTDDTIWSLTNSTYKNYPVYDFTGGVYNTFTFTPSAKTGNGITITSSSNIFSVNYIGGTFEGNQGLARIVSITSTLVAVVDVLTDFKDTNAILGSNAYLTEPAFSISRGFPRTIDFYQGRQFYGGTRDLPSAIFGSATFDAFNFDDTKATPSDAISIFISGNEINNTKFLIDNKDLFILTDNAEYSTPPFTDKPVSPENTYFVQQSKYGIGEVNPEVLDGKVIIIDKGGKIVRAVMYDVNQAKYVSKNISLLSPHLIRNPVDMAVFENPAVYDGSYLLVVNGDGTLAIFQYIEDEQIACWNIAITDGNFKKVVASGDYVVFLVERQTHIGTNDIPQLYLEKMDFNILTDSASVQSFGSPTSVIGNLSHLDGKTVKIIGDGFLLKDNIVASGQITLEKAVTNVQVGLPIDWEIIPLPAQYQTQTGNNKYLNKRVRTVYIDYYESLGININGTHIPSLNFSLPSFNNELVYKTGVYEYTNMDGWVIDEQIVVSGSEPLRFHIRAITFEVEE